jgi:hypothetical protein
VSAIFSHALQETTVTTASCTVRRGDGPEVGGAVTVATEGDTALFMPDGPLALLTAYTATLTTAIESLTGGAFDADYVWVFSTRDGGWGTGERIESDNAGSAFEPQVALDANGNALAVGTQSDGARDNIWSNGFE